MKHLVKWRHDPTGETGVWLLTDEQVRNLSMEVDVLEQKKYPDHFQLFRVVVAGGRDFNQFYKMMEELDFLLSTKEKDHAIVIVSGKANGADKLGEDYAELRGYMVDDRPADWDTFGKSAGYRRNVEMADNADAVVVFWDGRSRGSKHMVDIANNKGLPLRVVGY